MDTEREIDNLAIAKLPPAFQTIPLTEAERTAILQFITEAPNVAPGACVLSPRRWPSGQLKIVLEFPEGELWAMSSELVALVHRIEDETGVYLYLD